MLLDALAQFDSGSSLAIAAGSQASANTLDLLNARDLGIDSGYMPMKVLVNTGAAFASGGAGTLQVSFQGSTDNTTWTTYAQTRPYAIAELTAGSPLGNFDLPRPGDSTPAPRYLRLNYTVGGATMTAGTVSAFLSFDRYDHIAYPKAYPTPV